MKHKTIFSFVLIFTLLASLAASAAPVSKDEREAIQRWTSLKNGKGALLTPPVGKIQPKVQELRQGIKELVEKLAGPELRAKKAQIVVNIYATDVANAWVQEYDTTSKMEDGKETNELAKDASAIRSWFGFQNNTENFHEVGITTGLLKLLKTEGELAFVLGHELTHFLEGHTHREPGDDVGKAWWSSQSHEAVADNHGLELMVGKYDLAAAPRALGRLFPAKEEDSRDYADFIQALNAGASSHHQEGVRIAMVQFYSEYLRHFNPLAVPKEDPTLSEKFKLNVNGARTAKPDLSYQNEATFDRVISEYFLAGKEYEALTTSDDDYGFDRVKHPDELSGIGIDEHNMGRLFAKALTTISSSGQSKARQVNAAILTLSLLADKRSSDYKTFFDQLNSRELFELKRWFLERSVGDGHWTLESLKAEIGNLPFANNFAMESIFLGSKNSQAVLNDLVKTSPQWRGYWQYIFDPATYMQKGIVNTMSLYNKLSEEQPKEGSLTGQYQTQLFSMIKNIGIERLLQHAYKPGYSSYLNLVHQMNERAESLKEKDPGYKNLVTSWNKTALAKQFDDTVAILNDKNSDSTTKNSSLSALGDYLRDNAFEPRDDLTKGFVEFIKDVSINAELFPSEPFFGRDIMFHISTHVLNSEKFTREEKLLTLKYLASNYSDSLSLDRFNDQIKNSFNTAAKSFMLSLSQEEYLKLATDVLPSIDRMMKFVEGNTAPRGLNEKARFKWLRSRPDEDKQKMRKMAEYMFTTNTARQGLSTLLNFTLWSGAGEKLQSLSFNDLRSLILKLSEVGNRVKYLQGMGFGDGQDFELHVDTSSSILKMLIAKYDPSKVDFHNWFDTYDRTLKMTGKGYVPPEEIRTGVEKIVEGKISELPHSKRYQWLTHAVVRKMVSEEFFANELVEYLKVTAPNKTNRELLKGEIERIQKQLSLKDNHPEAMQLFKNKVAENYNLQPSETQLYFPEDERTLTEKVNGLSGTVRGLSAIAAFTRSQTADRQLEMIEYLMGRREKAPQFVEDAEIKIRQFSNAGISIAQTLQMARGELYFKNPIERALAVDSILAGPNGLAQTNVEPILNHILKNVAQDKKEIAEELARSLIKAEGENKSFVISYVLAQQPSEQNGPLSEAMVLKSLLDAYGVPGVKLGQYLAFSNEFKDYQANLESYQDAALPLNYYEALQLISKRFGRAWDPNRYQVTKVVGSGSVNVAVAYKDLKTGEEDVVSIARDQIDTKTHEDFRRFKMFINELTASTKQGEKYEFLVGLMDIIRRSVELEFDKASAFEMQRMAGELYSRKVNGWTVRTVEAYDVKNASVFMQKAPGKGARKILHDDPNTYKEAMRALLSVEFDVLRGVKDADHTKSVALFANPDLHDGQVLIDSENKTVTILDFGQAVKITNNERDFAVDILRIVSKSESVEVATKILEAHAKSITGKDLKFDNKEIAKIFERTERMDIFVHTVAYLERTGFTLPLSSIHWVLAANRLILLGNKVDVPAEKLFRNLVITKKVGFGVDAYNWAHHALDRMKTFFNRTENKNLPIQQSDDHLGPGARAIMCERIFSRAG